MWNIWKEQTFQILWGNCLVATTSWSEFDRRLHETPFYLQNDLTGLKSLFSTVCRKTPAEDSSHRNWSMGKTSSYTASFRSDGPACLGEPGSLCWCQYPGKLRSLTIQELPQLLARKLLHLPSQRSLTGLELTIQGAHRGSSAIVLDLALTWFCIHCLMLLQTLEISLVPRHPHFLAMEPYSPWSWEVAMGSSDIARDRGTYENDTVSLILANNFETAESTESNCLFCFTIVFRPDSLLLPWH